MGHFRLGRDKTMANTLAARRTGLLNWYAHPISTGPIEGFNNKARTMKRQAHGYRNMHVFMLKLRTLHTNSPTFPGRGCGFPFLRIF